MLLEGSELTKEDRESQLYDDFEHFRQHKEESINDYYVRFSKLINDMRNIKMIMPKLQLNSKFVNNMLPEWGRFVMAVKLNRGLRESNYDQLFAYLKQHEAHAKENKMVLERLSQPIAQPTIDPIALLSTISNTKHGLPSSSTSSITPLTPPRANSRYREAQNRVRNINQGQARPGQARTVKCYNCNGTRKWSSFGCRTTAFSCRWTDVDEAPTAQTMFMANLSSADPITDEAGLSYDSDILSEYVKDNDMSDVHSNASSVSNDTFMMIYDDMCKPIAPSVSNSLRNAVVKNSLTAKLATYREQVELPRPLYNDLNKKTNAIMIRDSEETLMLAEESRFKMLLKQKDLMMSEKKVNTKPVDYASLNQLLQDFETRFVPQIELSAEQVFWSQNSVNFEQVEVLKELPKV
nr:integrase, catalytic region, zinc finger, CCHC-type, peptidase aspartic, catalytic [Tanacetum cinerariifolium]